MAAVLRVLRHIVLGMLLCVCAVAALDRVATAFGPAAVSATRTAALESERHWERPCDADTSDILWDASGSAGSGVTGGSWRYQLQPVELPGDSDREVAIALGRTLWSVRTRKRVLRQRGELPTD